MSKVIWDGLSAEDRKIIKEAAKESQATQRKAWKEYEAKSIAAIKAGGKNTITELADLSAWQKAVQKLYTELDLGPKRDEYVKKIQSVK